MKGWVYRRYGSPDVLAFDEIDEPVPGADEIAIRVRASGLNAADWHIMRADPFLVRFAVGLRKPRRHMIIGSDVAGVVERVGEKVTRFAPGDAVYVETMLKGGCAEIVVARANRAALMPFGLTFEQAAAVPMAGVTALTAIRHKGRLQPGQSVLINGASGGVGTFAVQIARALGGRVTASCSAGAVDLVRSLGADEVLDYAVDDPIDSGRTYDLVVNIGGHALPACAPADAEPPWDVGGGRRVAARGALRPGERGHEGGADLAVRGAAAASGREEAQRRRSRDPRDDDRGG